MQLMASQQQQQVQGSCHAISLGWQLQRHSGELRLAQQLLATP
jgi:hypothetical protein